MKKFLVVVISSVILLGCSVSNNSIYKPPELSKNIIKPPSGSSVIEQLEQEGEVPRNKAPQKVSVVYVPMANVGQLKGYATSGKEGLSKGTTKKRALKVSVENMPVNEFIKLVFGKILKVSFFVGTRVQSRRDKITLNMTTPMPEDEFLSLVVNLLKRYGINVKYQDGMYFINYGTGGSKKPAIKYFIGRSIPKDIPPTERIGIIVPLYYIKAMQYASLIRRLALSRSSFIQILPGMNVLFIIDTPQYISAALDFIKLFDRPEFVNKTAVLLKLDYISPSSFVSRLKEMLPLEGVPVATGNSGGVVLKPLDDLSSVFVLTPKKEWLKFVYFWKAKLDTVDALGNKPRLFVFYPQNRRASDLARVFMDIEKGITETAPAGSKKKRKTKRGVYGFMGVKVVVDRARNALVILCAPSEYKNVKAALEKLDTLPKQVFVQVTILEVTLTGKLQYGLEWYLRHTGRFSGVLQTLKGLGLGAAGLNYSVVTDTSKFMAMINAFAQKNLVNVLSSPSLVVMDNKEATISVGTQVPVVTSESTAANIQDNGTTALVRTIQYRNTGVILTIKPTINSNGIVTMDVTQQVSDAQTNNISPGISSPLILNREINTSVTLKSGTTLLLGGLIKKSSSNTVNKVPLLGDIPILGNLFKTVSKGSRKTELIVEITPYILSDMSAAERISKSYRALMDLFGKK
ncbi:hypothetical protein [Persephonella sp.]